MGKVRGEMVSPSVFIGREAASRPADRCEVRPGAHRDALHEQSKGELGK